MPVNFPASPAMFGRLTEGGEALTNLSRESDPEFRLSDSGLYYELIYGSSTLAPYENPEAQWPLMFAYADIPASGNLLNGWTNYYTYPDAETAYVVTQEGSRTANGLDTPRVFRHSQLPYKVLMTQARPGTRPSNTATSAYLGHVSSIEIGTATQPEGRNCVWCFGQSGSPPFLQEDTSIVYSRSHPNTGAPIMGQYVESSSTEGGVTFYTLKGGVLEPNLCERWTDNAALTFGLALSNGGSGTAEKPVMFRAVHQVANGAIGPGVYDPTEVWSGPEFGYSAFQGNHYGVYNDPDRQTLHLVAKIGSNLHHFMSTQWGELGSWVENPSSPWMTPTAYGYDSEDSWGGPSLHFTPDGSEMWICCYLRPNNIIGNNGGDTYAGIYLLKTPRTVS